MEGRLAPPLPRPTHAPRPTPAHTPFHPKTAADTGRTTPTARADARAVVVASMAYSVIALPSGATTHQTSLTPWPFTSPGASSPAQKYNGIPS